MCKSQSHSVMLQYLKVRTHTHAQHQRPYHKLCRHNGKTHHHTHRAFLENGEMKLIECKSLHLFHRFSVYRTPCNCAHSTQCTTHAIHSITTIAFPVFVFSPCTYFQQSQSLEYILRNLMTFSRLVNIIHLSHGYWYNFYKLFALHRCVGVFAWFFAFWYFFNLLFASINFQPAKFKNK